MSSMYMIQNNNLEIWKGDKFSLGDRNTTKEKVFTQITIPILPQNTQIYLFSDGYQDQFGGYHHKKFMSKQFRELLFDNHKKTMSEQQQILDAAINQWISMGNETQTDDITVMGVRL